MLSTSKSYQSSQFFFDGGLLQPCLIGGDCNPAKLMLGIDPQIDPYSTQLSGFKHLRLLHTTLTGSTAISLIERGTSVPTSLPSGHTIAATASVIYADGNLGSTAASSVTVNGGTATSSWNHALSGGTQYLIRIFDSGSQIARLRHAVSVVGLYMPTQKLIGRLVFEDGFFPG